MHFSRACAFAMSQVCVQCLPTAVRGTAMTRHLPVTGDRRRQLYYNLRVTRRMRGTKQFITVEYICIGCLDSGRTLNRSIVAYYENTKVIVVEY